METKKLELEVPKEITEIGEALGLILAKVGEALQDGFQPGKDIPGIVSVAISNLGKAIYGAQNIPAEVREDATMAIMGVLTPVALGVKEVLKLKK